MFKRIVVLLGALLFLGASAFATCSTAVPIGGALGHFSATNTGLDTTVNAGAGYSANCGAQITAVNLQVVNNNGSAVGVYFYAAYSTNNTACGPSSGTVVWQRYVVTPAASTVSIDLGDLSIVGGDGTAGGSTMCIYASPGANTYAFINFNGTVLNQ